MIGRRCAIAEEKKQAKPRAACGGTVFREDVARRVRDRGWLLGGSPPKIDYDDDNDHDVLGLTPERYAVRRHPAFSHLPLGVKSLPFTDFFRVVIARAAAKYAKTGSTEEWAQGRMDLCVGLALVDGRGRGNGFGESFD